MGRTVPILVLAALIVWGQKTATPQFQYLYTFGSRQGIHPRTVLNRHFARAALGKGDNPYGLLFPVAVTTDLLGRVWITDSGTHSIHIFEKEGRAYREIRRVDKLMLDQPSGIASDAEGRIYVIDSGSGPCEPGAPLPPGEGECHPHKGGILAFDEKGEFDRWVVRRTSGVLERPTAMALSEDERTIYVADPPRNVIVELNREGEVNRTIPLPEELHEPDAIAVFHNQICVLGGLRHKVGVFSPAGVRGADLKWDDVQIPTAFGFDHGRRCFLVANPRWMIVQMFDEDGRNVGVFGREGDGVDQVQRIDNLHVDREGLIYVVDSHHGKVLVFAAR